MGARETHLAMMATAALLLLMTTSSVSLLHIIGVVMPNMGVVRGRSEAIRAAILSR